MPGFQQLRLRNRLLGAPLWAALLVVACARAGSAQTEVTLYGTVADATEPLAFATVGIPELNLGTTTDLDGAYVLPNVPPGTHVVVASYLGYGDATEAITVVDAPATTRVELDFTLSADAGISLDEVVVTGQAEGQRAAINQQVNSNTIVNVVSKERLQELPDQNAAESVGRLSGVSVYRDAGEGQRISVRGISPRLNSVTINGQRLPSTQQNDRSTDLSMISPDMLEGIELFKALTPDRDGDAIGGSVNFTVAKAREGLRATARVLGTYNGLAESFDNYRLNLSLSDRFGAGNRFGVIATANYQAIDRSNEFVTSDYEFVGLDSAGNARLPIGSLNLGTNRETRTRGGGSATLDFTPNERHSVVLSSTLGTTGREELRWRRRLRPGNSEQRLDLREREREILLVSNSLSGEHRFGEWALEWAGSYSFSRQRQPFSLRTEFFELAAANGIPEDPNDLDQIEGVFDNDLDGTALRRSEFETRDIDEDHVTAQLDLRRDYRFGESVNGYVKVGAKLRRVMRSADVTQDFLRPYLRGENPALDDPNAFLTSGSGTILLDNFLGRANPSPDFLDGRFDLQPGSGTVDFEDADGVDRAAYEAVFGARDGAIDRSTIADPARARAFYDFYRADYLRDVEGDLEDYDGTEEVRAAYAMAEVNLGPKLMLLGGLRVEQTVQDYASRIVAVLEEGEEGLAPDPAVVSANSTYTRWLPMAHARYQFTDWFDVRAAATKTLARPDFFNLVPWIRIDNSEQEINRGTPDLRNTDAWNFDIFASAYNKFGLLTVGAFYKELSNVDYVRTSVLLGLTGDEGVYNGYLVTQPDNVPESTVRGLEFDLQANLRALDNKVLKGIVFAGNITLLRSETAYPLLEIENIPNPTPPPFLVTRVVDTLRAGPLVGQADLIANASLGYEAAGFSGRLSLTFQGDALSPGNPGIGSSGTGVGTREELDAYDGSFTRLDLSLKQRITRQLTVVFNANNLLDTPERAFLFGGGATGGRLLQQEEFFGRTFDLGLFWRFRKTPS